MLFKWHASAARLTKEKIQTATSRFSYYLVPSLTNR